MAQFEMFADEAPAQTSQTADVDRVRRKLDDFLAEARAQSLPSARRRLIETVVPQMIRWLPADEAERVKRAFGEALAA